MIGHKVLVVTMAVFLLLVTSIPARAQGGISVDPPQGTPQAEEPKLSLDFRETVGQSFIAALQALINLFFQTIFGGGFLADLFGSLAASNDTIPTRDGPGGTLLATTSHVILRC